MPLNVNAREWRPVGELASFTLPTSTAAESDAQFTDIHYQEQQQQQEYNNNNNNTLETETTHAPSPSSSPAANFTRTTTTTGGGGVANISETPVYYPSFTQAMPIPGASQDNPLSLAGVNWTEEFERVMTLTRELIERQMIAESDGNKKNVEIAGIQGKHTQNSSAEQTPVRKSNRNETISNSVNTLLDNNRYPALPGTDEVRPLTSGRWVNAVMTTKTKNVNTSSNSNSNHNNNNNMNINNRNNNNNNNNTVGGKGRNNTSPGTTSAATPTLQSIQQEFDEFGRPLPPLTSKGNRRWKKPTKAQQKREIAQKNAFEAFANALLHSVSPFMAPLRERCKTSLPHIKVDQRFGKSGQPQTAVAQFVVAPLVTNYRPRHFHDLTPGDLMEFHYDFAQVLKQLKSANSIHIGYGPVWKRYAVPYCYVNCKEYRQEVLNLCPDEVPNMRVEAIYEDDIVKDITEVILSVEELEPLQNISIIQAMSRRVNLEPLFDAFDAIFQPIENYRIIIRDIHRAPSTFLIQTSLHEVEQLPSPIVLYNDPKLWYELPIVKRVSIDNKDSENISENPTINSTGTLTSNRQGDEKNKSGVNSINGQHNNNNNNTVNNSSSTANNRHRNKAQSIGTNSLAIVLPVLGSIFCLALTATILWRRNSKK